MTMSVHLIKEKCKLVVVNVGDLDGSEGCRLSKRSCFVCAETDRCVARDGHRHSFYSSWECNAPSRLPSRMRLSGLGILHTFRSQQPFFPLSLSSDHASPK